MAHSTTLIPLSPSTSHSSRSSLTSEESEFDHTALPTDTQAGFTKAPTLGVRELASMALSFPKPKVMAPQLSSEIALLKALGPQPDSAPFTREVEIKGWKIVGGKSWTDRAKVGAYVAKFSPDFLVDRQPRLQRFLRTVVLHPELGRGGKDSVIGNWLTDDHKGFVG
ncbi:MAG: hypothetical protein TREMPRED_002144 [Tremellales sp. Tagirdzhanova-0007]|nr:MAG: hypothetical protein TREMPRED_002144 [Tremellales sp. Tagirdzhanova-0007]